MIFKDDIGNQTMIPDQPGRIISLCPSITETLFELGAGKQVAGLTSYCIHPFEKTKKIAKIGGPRNPDITGILDLAPDLVITSREENRQQDVCFLRNKVPVITFDVKSIESARYMILRLGLITGRIKPAMNYVQKLDRLLRKKEPQRENYSVLYLVWKDPWMAAGHGNYICDLMHSQGFINILPEHSRRYPEIDPNKIERPDFIFLSSEPFPFGSEHIEEASGLFGGTRTILVDGEMFGWYGTRIIRAIPYIRTLRKKITTGGYQH
ncbi:MAG: ABC transporter substrate-binding protein [Bacteroidetes bacterium]|nr:ABC transporter substrate-binding protein [Bacteroidota bacterium]